MSTGRRRSARTCYSLQDSNGNRISRSGLPHVDTLKAPQAFTLADGATLRPGMAVWYFHAGQWHRGEHCGIIFEDAGHRWAVMIHGRPIPISELRGHGPG